MNNNYKRSSDVLTALIHNKNFSGKLSYQKILHNLGERAFGLLFLLFSLPSALPASAIPGVSLVFSIPIMIFALQMIVAKEKIWLPKAMANRTIEQESLSKIINTAVPYLIKIERFLRPRIAFMTGQIMDRLNGVIIFLLALLLALPIPFSNFIISMLIIFFSLGLIENDGVFIIIGYVGSICYLALFYLFILTAIKTIF